MGRGCSGRRDVQGMTGCGPQCSMLVERVMISQSLDLMVLEVFFKLILCLCDEPCSDLTSCAGFLKWKALSEGREHVKVMRGKILQLKINQSSLVKLWKSDFNVCNVKSRSPT